MGLDLGVLSTGGASIEYTGHAEEMEEHEEIELEIEDIRDNFAWTMLPNINWCLLRILIPCSLERPALRYGAFVSPQRRQCWMTTRCARLHTSGGAFHWANLKRRGRAFHGTTAGSTRFGPMH